jgi:hypothetical protein
MAESYESRVCAKRGKSQQGSKLCAELGKIFKSTAGFVGQGVSWGVSV